MFKLIDEQSGKEKFIGSEKECIEFTKENPNCNYIIIDMEQENKQK